MKQFLFLALLLAAPLTALAQPAPKPVALPAGIRMEKDLAYIPDGDPAQKLDLYLPEKSADKPLPLIMHIHGGGWRGGNKFPCPVTGMVLKGYVVASVEYRFSQKAIFPAQIQDCQAALRWLRARSKEYGIDPGRVGVIGGSAGGHLSALVGTAGGKKPEEKVDGMKAEQRARNEMAAILNANDKMEQQLTMDKLKALDDRINAETERKKAAIDAVNEYALEMERQHDAELHAQGKLTVKEQEELDKQRLEQAKSYLADYTTAFMQSQGRQLAIGKLSAKEAGDFARKQLGNAIMGLGDKAMAEAGIMAASLNPLAIPMAAAGVAAYAVGTALNADKKQVATEPPTEVAGAQAQPASYSFNLQVDSVFADGESVARQFARMQESARQRGLLTQGAY